MWSPLYLDMLSGPLFSFPGTCIVVNLNHMVFSAMDNNLGFSISSRFLSNTLTRGLWSVARRRFLQPSTQCLALCRASAMARHSPSIGLYRDSAGFVTLPPANTNFQPVLQHRGVSFSHEQYFCIKKKPMPLLGQSVARHVFLFMSNLSTPSVTARWATNSMGCQTSISVGMAPCARS